MFGIIITTGCEGKYQWPLGLRRRSPIASLLRLWVRIPPEEWMSVSWVLYLRRADYPSRGVLPTVVRRCVWSRNLVKEEVLAKWGGALTPQTNRVWRQEKAICIFNKWTSYQVTFYKSRKCYYIKHFILWFFNFSSLIFVVCKVVETSTIT